VDSVKKMYSLAAAAAILLSGCGAEENKETVSDEQNTTEGYNEQTNTEGEQEKLSAGDLDDRITEGMDYGTYSAEVQSWAEKGQLDFKESVKLDGGEEGTLADILQLADGFLTVSHDGQEVTEVLVFTTIEEAKETLKGETTPGTASS
jgi:major membrane immunogen (membrane-anchored lipoprotein)